MLGGCAACAVGLAGLPAVSPIYAQTLDTRPAPKTRIRIFFTHEPPEKATWLNIGYDYEGRKKELLAKLKKACPGIEFIPTIITRAHRIDGYVVYMVGIWVRASRSVAESGLPTVFVDDLYAGSGEFLTEYARAKRKGLKVVGVSSSDFGDVIEAVRCFECIKWIWQFNAI